MNERPCLSEYLFDRYMLDLLEGEERTSIEAHLKTCDDCARVHSRIAASWEAPGKVPVPQAQPEARVALASWFRVLFGWPLALAATAFLIAPLGSMLPKQEPLYWRLPTRLVAPVVPRKRVKIKGSLAPKMVVYLKRAGEVRVASSGAPFVKGDQLRLSYRSTKGLYLFVVYRDDAGRLMPLYPEKKGKRSLRLTPKRWSLLSGQIDLEGDSLQPEHILSCFSNRPLTFVEVRRFLSSHPRGSGCGYLLSFTLNKRSKRKTP